jgi:hypothetical protein
MSSRSSGVISRKARCGVGGGTAIPAIVACLRQWKSLRVGATCHWRFRGEHMSGQGEGCGIWRLRRSSTATRWWPGRWRAAPGWGPNAAVSAPINTFGHARELVTAKEAEPAESSPPTSTPSTAPRSWLQFIDDRTNNFAYIGSRSAGPEAGDSLIVGRGWTGEPPDGMRASTPPPARSWWPGESWSPARPTCRRRTASRTAWRSSPCPATPSSPTWAADTLRRPAPAPTRSRGPTRAAVQGATAGVVPGLPAPS